MKHHHSPRGGRLLLLGTACLGSVGTAFAQQEVPHGKLTVDNTLVRVGAQSQLTWQIQYDRKIGNLVEILPPQIISTKEELNVRVRVIGSGKVAVKTDSGHGNNLDGYDSSNTGNKSGVDESAGVDDETKIIGSTTTDMPVEVMASINHSDWSRVFYGLQSVVVPTDVVLETKLQPGDTINIASRGYTTKWLPLHSTNSDDKNVILLKNGDAVPKQISTRQYGQIQAFIKPYLSTDGKTVKIGDNELIVLFELDNQNPNAAGFDYQDIGVLVTFD